MPAFSQTLQRHLAIPAVLLAVLGTATGLWAVERPGSNRLSAGASVTQAREVRTYVVSGSTPGDLMTEMEAKCPPMVAGEKCWATTSWNVTWTYRWQSAGGTCRITEAAAHVAIVQTYPEWWDPSAGSPRLRDSWEGMLSGLHTHEDGHAENGVRAAEEIASRIRKLAPKEDCEDFDHAATRLGYEIAATYRAKDREFDSATNHGATQIPKLGS